MCTCCMLCVCACVSVCVVWTFFCAGLAEWWLFVLFSEMYKYHVLEGRSGVEWSGVEWSGVEWSGVEWSRELSGG